MTNRLVFELDVDPPETSPPKAIDYAGRIVSAFTTMPLFQYTKWGGEPVPALLEAAEAKQDGIEWALYPRHTVASASDTKLTSQLLLEMLSPARKLHMRPSERFLRDELKSIELNGRSGVLLRLRRPMPFLSEILSADAFASIDEKDKELSFGPYSLSMRYPGKLLGLTKNEIGCNFYHNGPQAVFFLVTRSPNDGVRLFEQGLIDVTSNPNLPSAAMERYRSSSHLHTQPLAMAGVLVSRSMNNISPIHYAINRARICNEVKEGLTPLENIMDIFGTETIETYMNGQSSQYFSHTDLSLDDYHLTIAYANFPPNKEVVERIAEDLMLTSNLQVQTVPLSYNEYIQEIGRQTYDFIYALIQPALPEPVMFLEQLIRWGKQKSSSEEFTASLLRKPYLDRLDDCRTFWGSMLGNVPIIPVVRHMSKFLASNSVRDLRLSSDGLFRPSLCLE